MVGEIVQVRRRYPIVMLLLSACFFGGCFGFEMNDAQWRNGIASIPVFGHEFSAVHAELLSRFLPFHPRALPKLKSN